MLEVLDCLEPCPLHFHGRGVFRGEKLYVVEAANSDQPCTMRSRTDRRTSCESFRLSDASLQPDWLAAKATASP